MLSEKYNGKLIECRKLVEKKDKKTGVKYLDPHIKYGKRFVVENRISEISRVLGNLTERDDFNDKVRIQWENGEFGFLPKSELDQPYFVVVNKEDEPADRYEQIRKRNAILHDASPEVLQSKLLSQSAQIEELKAMIQEMSQKPARKAKNDKNNILEQRDAPRSDSKVK